MPHFVDTNVVVYAQTSGAKRAQAAEVLAGAVISVQILNELTLVARRRLKLDWQEIEELIIDVDSACSTVMPVDRAVHAVGRQLANRYQLAVYDSFIVSAALLSNCDVLYSEDMQNGLVIEGVLTIRNPFA